MQRSACLPKYLEYYDTYTLNDKVMHTILYTYMEVMIAVLYLIDECRGSDYLNSLYVFHCALQLKTLLSITVLKNNMVLTVLLARFYFIIPSHEIEVP